ncbi:MAG: TIM barrel protein [Cyclobacteriaceae bacterium]|nr:TIM barrel protein [Cyclobacteriaceae bacterium HetDA_MAG_MS6]
MKISRKQALRNIGALSAVSITGLPALASCEEKAIKGKVNHSVCKWPYSSKTLEELCQAAQAIGISSVELLDANEWTTVQQFGLTCAMANGSPLHIPKGFNNPIYHEQLLKDYSDLIPKVAHAGLKNIICFSGNRDGMDDATGLENSAKGLEPVVKLAQKYGITVCMELLNSKIDHKDYQCDHTTWGVALAEKLGSAHFKLLYDIYHMQIMEGDVIRTIRDYHPYIAHYHTGGVPGRNEIDETQELNYSAIVRAIIETGFDGYIAQEFIPKNKDVFASLKQGVTICDV